jgi:hypothetical protein
LNSNPLALLVGHILYPGHGNSLTPDHHLTRNFDLFVAR